MLLLARFTHCPRDGSTLVCARLDRSGPRCVVIVDVIYPTSSLLMHLGDFLSFALQTKLK